MDDLNEQRSKREEMVDVEEKDLVNEKTPDDMCFEGGDCKTTGHLQAIVGDLRTLAAKDNPDDLEGEPYNL